jgi:hypothetical protein
MSFTHTITDTYSDNAGIVVTTTVSKTGSEVVEWDGTIPVSTTNQALQLAFTMASMQMICITATGALTLKTNSTGSPAQTITLTANQSITWYTGSAATNPITADVTEVFATNASGTIVPALKIRVLITP